jgi:lipoyl(octanoyl) transferase
MPAIDLGRLPYADAYRLQTEQLDRVIASRGSDQPIPGVILLVEHDPVITITRRPDAPTHLLASADILARAGVAVEPTDRGGDVTYHGPGQLVVYPIIDLNAHALRIVDYVRLLETAIIDALAALGLDATTDPGATGVWTARAGLPHAKVAAIGVRIRKWVSMHGLAINVDPDMSHFGLIVPCGLHGRAVTSLRMELGDRCPTMDRVKAAVVGALRGRLAAARARQTRRQNAEAAEGSPEILTEAAGGGTECP